MKKKIRRRNKSLMNILCGTAWVSQMDIYVCIYPLYIYTKYMYIFSLIYLILFSALETRLGRSQPHSWRCVRATTELEVEMEMEATALMLSHSPALSLSHFIYSYILQLSAAVTQTCVHIIAPPKPKTKSCCSNRCQKLILQPKPNSLQHNAKKYESPST